MNLLNHWILYVILYIILSTIFTQFYKIATQNLKNAGALTVILEIIGVITALLICPFFNLTFPTNFEVWIFLGLSIIFYAITDRVNTTVRSGIEASTFSILKQLSTTFLTLAGFLFLNEEFIFHKFLGAMLIILSNIFIFYKKGEFKMNRYIGLGVLANLSFTIAMFLDVNLSKHFNLPFYVAMTLGIPAILIALTEKIKISEMKEELKIANKKSIIDNRNYVEFVDYSATKGISIAKGKYCCTNLQFIGYFKCNRWLSILKRTRQFTTKNHSSYFDCY